MDKRFSKEKFQLAIIICSTLDRNSFAITLNSIRNIPNTWQVILVCPNIDKNKYQNLVAFYQQVINLILIEDAGTGIYDAMNLGLKNTKSEFILFLNDDDELIEENIGKVSTKLKEMDDNDILFLPYQEKRMKSVQIAYPKNLFETGLGRMPTSHQAQIWPKQLLDELNGFRSKIRIPGLNKMIRLKLVADFEVYLRAIKLGVKKEIFLEPLTTVTTGGISDRKFHRRIFETILILIDHKKIHVLLGFWYFFKFEAGNLYRKVHRD
jgi:glycosyltransferase involved in cell wall biosynthesis